MCWYVPSVLRIVIHCFQSRFILIYRGHYHEIKTTALQVILVYGPQHTLLWRWF